MEIKSFGSLALRKIRSLPEVVFDYRDKRGVECAFRSMLDIFSAEAVRGHGDEIEVYCLKDSYYSIRLKSDRCLDIGFEDGINDRWIEVFTRFISEDTDYTEFLFGNADKKSEGPAFDGVELMPMLACNQLVCEHMVVRVKAPGALYGRIIEFRNGEISALPCECNADHEGTHIFFKYDSCVFDEITLSEDFLNAALHEAAIANKGIKYTLKEVFQGSNLVFPTSTYFYKDSKDYIEETAQKELLFPVFECRRTHTGSDIPDPGLEYTAQVDVSVGVTKNSSEANCFYNGRRLSEGGKFLDGLYSSLTNAVNCVADRHAGIELTEELLKKHLIVNVDIRTVGCVPYWGDGNRRSLDNLFIANIVRDVCRRELYDELFADKKAIAEKLVDLIIEQEKLEVNTVTLQD